MTASYKRPFQPAAPPSASSSMPLTSTHTHAEPLSNFLFSSSFAPTLSLRSLFRSEKGTFSLFLFHTYTPTHPTKHSDFRRLAVSLQARPVSSHIHTYTQRLVIYLFYFYKQNSALYCQLTRTHTHTHPLHPLYTHFCTHKQPVYFSLPPLVLISSKTC